MADARRAGDSDLFFALINAAAVDDVAGSTDNSTGALRTALAIAERNEHEPASALAAAELSCLLARGREFDEAAALAEAARHKSSPEAFRPAILWRRTLAHVAANEERMDHAMELTDEAVADASGRGWLTFRGQTLEDAADIRGRATQPAHARRS